MGVLCVYDVCFYEELPRSIGCVIDFIKDEHACTSILLDGCPFGKNIPFVPVAIGACSPLLSL
jgi:hypothetical protein